MVVYVTSPFQIESVPKQLEALKGPDFSLTYEELQARVSSVAKYLESFSPGLLLLGFETEIDSIVTYLAAMQTRRSIMLIDPRSNNQVVQNLTEKFRPALLGGVLGLGSTNLKRLENPFSEIPDSSVFLPTSGSTGSSKMVRLSIEALTANAQSIVQGLQLSNNQIAPLNLPLFYSYGLSVLNSHLLAGACLALPGQNFMEAAFWKNFDAWGCTSLAGVPVNYEMLKRLKFNPKDHPSLTYMTQAGGRLPLELQDHFHRLMNDSGRRFFVMYGQTEAGARMAILPHDEFEAKRGSVGFAIPNGQFKILNDENLEVGTNSIGHIVYSGPNVMFGYCERAEDALAGDLVKGFLTTGDVGYLDDDQCLWITGRSKRIAKIFGMRVNLDDVEQIAFSRGYIAAAIAGEDRLILVIEGQDDHVKFTKELARELGVHHSGIKEYVVSELPTLPSGKRDYSQLMSLYN